MAAEKADSEYSEHIIRIYVAKNIQLKRRYRNFREAFSAGFGGAYGHITEHLVIIITTSGSEIKPPHVTPVYVRLVK